MARLVWDSTGEHLYETGVRRGVLYLLDENDGDYPEGVAWNGLTSVTESPSGAEATAIYADDIKYLNLYSAEEFGATIEAYTYPDEFAQCDGSATLVNGAEIGQQSRKAFGLCYRTAIGNDVAGEDFGYKLHIIYGCKASPSEKSYQTINDSPEAITFSWEVTTTPVAVTGFRPTATVIVDSTKFADATTPATDAALKAALAKLEAYLYGADSTAFNNATMYVLGDTCTSSSKYYVCTKAAVAGTTTTIANNFTEIATTSAWDGKPRLPLPDEIKTLLTVT